MTDIEVWIAALNDVAGTLDQIRRNLAAFSAGSNALDPDGYPTGSDTRGGRGPADPTANAATAPKRGRQARRDLTRRLLALRRDVDVTWGETMRPVLDQVPRRDVIDPSGPAGFCTCCRWRWCDGQGDNRRRQMRREGDGHWWCDPCRKAWERAAGQVPLSEFVAQRRERAEIKPRRMPA